MINRIHNIVTGEITDVPFTPDEIKEYEKVQKEQAEKNAASQAEAEAKATARQAILDRLGLTADEAKLLLG
jgi:hypothetical protein